jgi:hypothetical protein
MVGMVVTISPSLSLYRMVVLPAASNPTWSEGPSGREVSAPSHCAPGRASTETAHQAPALPHLPLTRPRANPGIAAAGGVVTPVGCSPSQRGHLNTNALVRRPVAHPAETLPN